MQASSRCQTTSSMNTLGLTRMGSISSTPNNRCRHFNHTHISNNLRIKVHSYIPIASPPLVLYGGRLKKGGSGGLLPKPSITLAKATNWIKGAGLICPNPLHGQRTHRIMAVSSATAPRDMILTLQAVEQRLHCALRNQKPRDNRTRKLPPRQIFAKARQRHNPMSPSRHLAPAGRPLMESARLLVPPVQRTLGHFAAIGLDAPRLALTLAPVIVLRLISRLNT